MTWIYFLQISNSWCSSALCQAFMFAKIMRSLIESLILNRSQKRRCKDSFLKQTKKGAFALSFLLKF
ncbi:hypothetical protein B8T70_22460 [Flavobacterium sp. AJR]|nr:hypothetical protein B8T70_22460 [Flavobacterium sp. AJR]